VLVAGATAVAVVRAITAANDPAAATRQLLELLDRGAGAADPGEAPQ
jgi:thiamine monophosphate synthase